MQRFARIAEGRVVEIVDLPETYPELVVDEQGRPVLIGGTPVFDAAAPVLDDEGAPVLDDEGQPVMADPLPRLDDEGAPLMEGGDFQYRDRPMVPADAFTAELAVAMITCPEGIAPGWSFNGEAFAEPLPLAPDLASLKAARIGSVNAERDRMIADGYRHNFGGSAGIRTLDQRNEADAINWLGLKGIADAMVAADQGAGLLPIRDASDDTFTASASVVGAALIGMAQWRGAVMGRSWQLKDAIDAAEDQPALDAIDTGSGWPGA